MKQNEVVGSLNAIKFEMMHYKYHEYGDVANKHIKALTKAIRCVELLPELVEALENSIDTTQHAEYRECWERLLKKAKGLSE